MDQINEGYVFPALKEVYAEQKGDKYLIINSLGPNWFITNTFGYYLLHYFDGKTSFGELEYILSKFNVNWDSVVNYLNFLNEINFFSEGKEEEVSLIHDIFLNLTSFCNLKCIYCYYNSGRAVDRSTELTINMWEKIIYQIKDINPQANVYISGGEPMTSSDFYSILDFLAEMDLRVILFTNATLLNDFAVKKLKKYTNIENIQISLDSIVSSENIISRGIDSAKIIGSILLAKNNNLPITIACTLTRININSIQQILDFCTKVKVRIRFIPYFPAAGKAANNLKIYEVPKDEILINMKKLRLPEDPKIRPLRGYRRLTRRVICGLGRGSVLSIAPTGLVYPCNHLYENKFILGDVRDEPLLAILDKAKKLIKPVSVENMTGCKRCGIRFICGGTCRANSYYAKKRFDVKSKDCSFNKAAVLETLWLQCEYNSTTLA